MPLSDIATITISTSAKGVTRKGFGVPLIAAYHAHYAERVREYTTLAAMVTDGFTVNEPAYKVAAQIAGQTPRVAKWKVGRRALPFTQSVKLTPASNTVGTVYTVTVLDPAGNSTVCTNTVVTGETISQICTALASQIGAVTDLSATSKTTYVDVDADNAGDYFYFNDHNNDLGITDVTPDPGIATDLAAIELADSDWYGLAIDSNSEAEIKASQAYVETLEKIAGYHTCDAGVRLAATTDDIISDLQDGSYVRCLILSSKDYDGYSGAAWLGRILPQNPGRSTAAFKTLTGVTVDSLTSTQAAAILAKGGNIYTTVAGLNITENGQTPYGTYIDITIGRDWLVARLRERIIYLLANTLKIPYTDSGVSQVVTQVRAQLREGQSDSYQYIATDPEFVITFPKVADVSASDRANRLLPDINFTATLQGAIHKIEISGVVSV